MLRSLYGRHYSDGEITAMFGITEEGMIRRVLPACWQEGERAYLAEYERLHDGHVQLFPASRARYAVCGHGASAWPW